MIFIGLMKIRISGHWTMNLNLPEKEIGSLTERQGRYRWCPGKVKGYLCEEICYGQQDGAPLVLDMEGVDFLWLAGVIS